MKTLKTTILIILIFNGFLNAQENLDYFFKGLAALEYSEYQNAINYFSESINSEDYDYQDYILRGQTYYQIPDFENAIADFKRANELKDGVANFYLAKCYALIENTDSSLFFLKENLNSPQKVLKSDILTDNDFDNLKSTSEWIDFIKEDLFSAYDIMLNDANYSLKKEKFIEALETVNLIINKNKRKHQAWFLKGNIFMEMGNYKSAVECYETASELSKNNIEYCYQLAEAYYFDKKYKKSSEQCNLILEKNPKNLNIYLLLAKNYYKTKDYNEAKLNIEFFLKYFDKNIEAKNLYVNILIENEEYLSAIKEINKLIDENPSNSEYYYWRGKSYLNSSSYQLAINDFTYALDLNPTITDIYYYRGQAKQLSGDLDGACSDWNKSIQNGDYKANNMIIEHCNSSKK